MNLKSFVHMNLILKEKFIKHSLTPYKYIHAFGGLNGVVYFYTVKYYKIFY